MIKWRKYSFYSNNIFGYQRQWNTFSYFEVLKSHFLPSENYPSLCEIIFDRPISLGCLLLSLKLREISIHHQTPVVTRSNEENTTQWDKRFHINDSVWGKERIALTDWVAWFTYEYEWFRYRFGWCSCSRCRWRWDCRLSWANGWFPKKYHHKLDFCWCTLRIEIESS